MNMQISSLGQENPSLLKSKINEIAFKLQEKQGFSDDKTVRANFKKFAELQSQNPDRPLQNLCRAFDCSVNDIAALIYDEKRYSHQTRPVSYHLSLDSSVCIKHQAFSLRQSSKKPALTSLECIDFLCYKHEHENITLKALAKSCDISADRIRRWTRTTSLQFETILKIDRAFGGAESIKAYIQKEKERDDYIRPKVKPENVAAFYKSTKANAGITDYKLLKDSGLTRSMLRDLIEGKTLKKPVFVVTELSRVFNCSLDDILHFEPTKTLPFKAPQVA